MYNNYNIINLHRNAIELTENIENRILLCIKEATIHPQLLLSETIIEKNINKLQNFESSKLNGIIGNYYLKHKKVYI